MTYQSNARYSIIIKINDTSCNFDKTVVSTHAQAITFSKTYLKDNQMIDLRN